MAYRDKMNDEIPWIEQLLLVPDNGSEVLVGIRRESSRRGFSSLGRGWFVSEMGYPLFEDPLSSDHLSTLHVQKRAIAGRSVVFGGLLTSPCLKTDQENYVALRVSY